jgi:hypothetical protein
MKNEKNLVNLVDPVEKVMSQINSTNSTFFFWQKPLNAFIQLRQFEDQNLGTAWM